MQFITPDPNDKAEWADIIRIVHEGRLNISFSNSKFQEFKLSGILLRPKIILQTQKPSKNDKAQHEIDLGVVNTERGRTMTFFLSNQTAVAAWWSLNYVKFPKKQTIGYMTMT